MVYLKNYVLNLLLNFESSFGKLLTFFVKHSGSFQPDQRPGYIKFWDSLLWIFFSLRKKVSQQQDYKLSFA